MKFINFFAEDPSSLLIGNKKDKMFVSIIQHWRFKPEVEIFFAACYSTIIVVILLHSSISSFINCHLLFIIIIIIIIIYY